MGIVIIDVMDIVIITVSDAINFGITLSLLMKLFFYMQKKPP